MISMATLEDELLLENEARQESMERLQKMLANTNKGETFLGGKILMKYYEDISKEFEVMVNKRGKTIQGYYLKPLEDIKQIYGEDTYKILYLVGASILLDTCIDRKDKDKQVLSGLASRIGKKLNDEATIKKFLTEKKDIKEEAWKAPSMIEGINHRAWESYKIAYAVKRMNDDGYKGRLKWDKGAQEALGSKIIEVFVTKGLYILENCLYTSKGRTKYLKLVKPSSFLKELWEKNMDKCMNNVVGYWPTIIPPKKWTSPYSGAYYGASMLNIRMIRMGHSNRFVRNYIKRLSTVDLNVIYDALNSMQETKFCINNYIFDVMTKIYNNGGGLGLPLTQPLPNLPRLPKDSPEEAIKEHKHKMAEIYKKEEVRKSKALRALMALKTAEKFKDYEGIWFPWNIDYRGRCYPIPTSLSPQGDDIQKALLVFGDPEPIKEADVKWLKIHGANLAGVDKVTFDERQAWIDENTDNIIKSAKDPISYTWWYEVSKGDYPLEFLAFCEEYKRLQEYKEVNGTYDGFLSRIPVAFDGTCSGLQHFSALLRDEIGGKEVNLCNTGKVEDIYSVIADKVNKVLLQDAMTGTDDTTDKEGKQKFGSKTLARDWIAYGREVFGKDGITRKVCKRSVMTLAYGSRQYGFKQNLLEDIIKPYELEHSSNSAFSKPNQDAVYMAKLIWNAVSTTVVKAVEGMEWLQKIAKLITKNGEAVSWITPNGFVVMQSYAKMIKESMQLRFSGERIHVYYQEESQEVDTHKQCNGIAPNFIHSLDATHLQRVVISEALKGNKNFAMIHDSFGTSVAHAESMYKTIREEFVALYQTNILEDFLADVEYLINDEDIDKIPAMPSYGSLNIEEVKESKYCFA